MGLIVRGTKSGTGTTSFGPSTVAKSSEVNTDLNTVYSEVNGNLDNDNIASDAAIASTKLDLSSISQSVTFTNAVGFDAAVGFASVTCDTLQCDSLQLTSGTIITSILDEDDMASDSASAVPTQQSVKAYVDAVPSVVTASYDSGWFAIAKGADYSKSHNLGTTALIIQAYFATDGSGSNMTLMPCCKDGTADTNDYSSITAITTTSLTLRTTNIGNLMNIFASGGGSFTAYTTGYGRIIALALA